MKPVRWGVLSTARIGLEKVIPAMQAAASCDIAAIASRDLGKAREAARALGIPQAYGSYDELIAAPDIEAVYNPLPNHLHVPLSLAAVQAGKHVLCEKPIALTADELAPLIVARDAAGVLVQEAFMVRHHPQWLQVRDDVRSGLIGELRAVHGFFSYNNRDASNIRNIAQYGGGGLYDIGCYPITCARYLFEDEPLRVMGLIEWDPEWRIDRLTSAILEFRGGHATFTCATQVAPHQCVDVIGTKQRIQVLIPFNAPPDEACVTLVDDGSRLGGASAKLDELSPADQYRLQGEAFSQCVRTGEPLEFPLENAAAGMRVIDAVFRSARSGRWEAP